MPSQTLQTKSIRGRRTRRSRQQLLPWPGSSAKNTLRLGEVGWGLSRNRVIFHRNSRHYRESGVPLHESGVFYRAARDRCPSNSQHYRESATSWRESDVFSRSAGSPPWVGVPGGRRGAPGHLSVPRRGSSSLKRSRPLQNQGNSAISQRRARSAFTKRSLDHERETMFGGRLAKYYEFPRAHRPGVRVRVVNYYVNCKVWPACFCPNMNRVVSLSLAGFASQDGPPNRPLPHGETLNSQKNTTRKRNFWHT